MQSKETLSSPQGIESSLNEIDRILNQMLAELSAGDSSADRQSLQKVLERLQAKIDRIADRLDFTKS